MSSLTEKDSFDIFIMKKSKFGQMLFVKNIRSGAYMAVVSFYETRQF